METLQIPQGKIIDLEKSDLSKNLIVLKEDKPKISVVDSWEELVMVTGFFISLTTNIIKVRGRVDCINQNKNIYPTLLHTKRALAEPQLLQIRERALHLTVGVLPKAGI